MRIFTNGKLTVLLTPTHVFRWPRRGEASVVARESPEATDFDESGHLLVSSKGEEITGAWASAFDPATLLDCGLVDDRRAAFLHHDQTLTWGPPPDGGEWEHRVDLSAHRSEFPDWARPMRMGPRGVRQDLEGEDLEYELERLEAAGAGFPHGVVLANAHGIGVASNFSGNVALFRPDQEVPALRFRLGVVDEDRIYARPTRTGLLVTVVFNGRFSTILHVDERGALRAHVPEQQGGRTPMLAMGRYALDVHDSTAYTRDAKLAVVSELDVTFRPACAAASPDGKHFAIADGFGADMALFSVSAKGAIREIDRVSYADLRRQASAEEARVDAIRRYALDRLEGTPTIGFAAKPVVSPPWTVPSGDFALPLVVRSAGGPGRGVAVRLSGAALEGVTATRVRLGDAEAAFSPDDDGLRAELPDVALPPGVVLPITPPPAGDEQKAMADAQLRETHLELVVHGHAAGPSGALLRVEVSALGATSSPLKWMRPLTVES